MTGQSPAPLARLPLQIGVTSTWSSARAAIALFPGLAIIGAGIALLVADDNPSPSQGVIGAMLLCTCVGALFVAYALLHMRGALRTRASDLLLLPDGLVVDGGRLHGKVIAWSDLAPPYARIEDIQVTRLTLPRIFLFILSLFGRWRWARSPVARVRIWRLWVHERGSPLLIAETDRPIESDSMSAAASSVEAVVTGRRYVEGAPAIAVPITACGACGAPAVPDDVPFVVCTYCGHQVVLSPQVRGQAAAAKALGDSRATTAKMIAKLREQPRATRTNIWLAAFTVIMFGAWPIGWGIIAFRVLGDGFQWTDVLFLALPLAAVLAGFFFARAKLADRGALQLLTLGFGALAPRQQGEASRCRRCQGPLPSAGVGGVVQCRYCSAENIVGLDLRPSVDPARTEQHTFDKALRQRRHEKILWSALTVVATAALVGWIGGTAAYLMHADDALLAYPAELSSAVMSQATGTAPQAKSTPSASPRSSAAPTTHPSAGKKEKP